MGRWWIGVLAAVAAGVVAAGDAAARRIGYQVETVAKQLPYPVALAFLPSGDMLVGERGGQLRVVTPSGRIGPPIRGLPLLDTDGQAGLLDVAVHPDFARNRRIYLTYTRRVGALSGTVLATGRLARDMGRIAELKDLFVQAPFGLGRWHYGGRILLDGRGHIYVTMGDRNMRSPVQALDNSIGKVIRLTESGEIPADNPLAGRRGVERAIWTYGHRNGVALVQEPASGRIYQLEPGPLGGDELNLLEPFGNYGWPLVSWGVEYDGSPLGGGETSRPGLEDSVYHWDPVITPRNAVLYPSGRVPEWAGDLFIAGLDGTGLTRLTLRDGRVMSEERLLRGDHLKLYDVDVGPDGCLYLLTDEPAGRVLRVVPRP